MNIQHTEFWSQCSKIVTLWHSSGNSKFWSESTTYIKRLRDFSIWWRQWLIVSSLSYMLLNTILRACWDIYGWDVIANISAVRADMRQVLNNSKTGFTPYCFAAAAKSLQSCPTLCDPMDRSLPGSSVHGIF